jgi:type III secretion system YscQ/HrcQ family protein
MRQANPYRTELWPRWSRRSAALSSAIARQWFQCAPVSDRPLGERLEALLGPCSFELRCLSVQTREALARTYAQRPSIFALFAMESGSCALALDAPLARWVSARCSGVGNEEALRWLAPMPFNASMEGAFALACILGAQRLCAPGPAPLFRAATERWDDVERALPKGECAVWPFVVRVGTLAANAALIVSASDVRVTRERDASWWPRASALSVQAQLVCARAMIDRAELAELRVGSALVIGAPLRKTERGSIAGPMTVALGPVECPVLFDRDPPRIVCDGALRAKRSDAMTTSGESSDENHSMHSSETDPAARTALLAGVPVEVEIVIARGVFAVGEVAAWRPGEVIALPTRVGEPVEVRAGGRVIARAELCDVEGEVGVRVLELLG